MKTLIVLAIVFSALVSVLAVSAEPFQDYAQLDAVFPKVTKVPNFEGVNEFQAHPGSCISSKHNTSTPSVLTLKKDDEGVYLKVEEIPIAGTNLAKMFAAMPKIMEFKDQHGHWMMAATFAQIKNPPKKTHYTFGYHPNTGRNAEGGGPKYYIKQITGQFSNVQKELWVAAYGLSATEVSEYCVFFATPAIALNPSLY